MSERNLPKRRVVNETKKELFEMKVNSLADAGYTMEHFAINPGLFLPDIEVDASYVAVMKLKTEAGTDFSGVSDIMVVPIAEVKNGNPLGSPLIAKCIVEGWRIFAFYKGTKDTPSTAILGKMGMPFTATSGKVN